MNIWEAQTGDNISMLAYLKTKMLNARSKILACSNTKRNMPNFI